jgi:SOS response regulatory protein OraA/RecX
VAAETSAGVGPEGAAYQTAVRLLAARRLSKAGLARKLRERGFAPQAVAEAVAVCERKGFVDDHAFARLHVMSTLERKAVGPARLLRELVVRGIEPELARAVVEESGAGTSEHVQRALSRLEALRPGERPDRVARRLTRLGFTPAQIARALRLRQVPCSGLEDLA